MKCKIVLTIAGLVLLSVKSLLAQVPSFSEEALFLSRIQTGGSSRVLGMGGVQNSLGGDISSASYNPAGLGMYNRSEFTISPGYTMTSSSSSYLGNTNPQSKNTLIIPNFGIAFHNAQERTSGFLGGTFAISYNRTNSFNNSFTFQGKNNDNSVIDSYIQNANGTNVSQFDNNVNNRGYNYNSPTGLAYNNYLIGPLTDTQYFTDVYPYLPTQSGVVKNTGSQGQWNFSYGANFSDKVFVGLGVGLASFKYKTNVTYTETFLDPYPGANPTISPMSQMVSQESFTMSGTGINATLGAIYRPLDIVQLGVSIATPTSFQITSEYSASLNTVWINWQYDSKTYLDGNLISNTDLVTFDHTLSTPWRLTGGATFFIQKKGLISADVEYLSYPSAKYSSYSDSSSPDVDNKDIKSTFQSALNIRIGGEYRINKYRVRAGYSLMPDPYKTSPNGLDYSINFYSFGVGYRTSSFYIDVAGILGQTNQSYNPYILKGNPTSPHVSLKNSTTTIAVTLGFPF